MIATFTHRVRFVCITLVMVSFTTSPFHGLASGANVHGLQDQLETQLLARRPVEIAFLRQVVHLVEIDVLPIALVHSTMLWARQIRPHPFPYFRRVMILRARRLGVELE